ncbi:hypothetical protein Pelo_7658 [Pelomyxa schiedti]|nr:hypothetical protein Pelo_7658 [Pelomyxa schiedti]
MLPSDNDSSLAHDDEERTETEPLPTHNSGCTSTSTSAQVGGENDDHGTVTTSHHSCSRHRHINTASGVDKLAKNVDFGHEGDTTGCTHNVPVCVSHGTVPGCDSGLATQNIHRETNTGNDATGRHDSTGADVHRGFGVTVKVLAQSSFVVRVVPEDTVSQLIDLAIVRCPELQNKVLKIIYKGRALASASTLESVGMTKDCVVHIIVSNPDNEVRVQMDTDVPIVHEPRNRMQNWNQPRTASETQSTHTTLLYGEDERHGFDRLATVGLSHEEIAQLREVFSASRANSVADFSSNAILSAEDAVVDEMLGLREATPQPRLRNANDPHIMHYNIVGRVRAGEGSNTDLLFGVILGFSLGTIILFWLRDKSLPQSTKLGVVVGLCISLVVAVLSFTR